MALEHQIAFPHSAFAVLPESSGILSIGRTACEGSPLLPAKSVALAPLARRATGCAGRFACHAVQRSASRVSEFRALPQVRVKGARLQNGARSISKSASCPCGEADAIISGVVGFHCGFL